MVDKIYVISCSQDLASMGVSRIRTAVAGLEETTLALDWSDSKLVPVVASEKLAFTVGETKIINIRPIQVPAYSMVVQSFYGVNGAGHLLCIGAFQFKPFSEDRIAEVAMLQSRLKSSVLPGDLLGQVIVVPGSRR
jgi:hypothetical protein